MQLIATTPTGLCLIFDATLTGGISLCTDGHTVDAVEVKISAVCLRLRGTGPEELPGPANGLKLLWVKPDDLCENGTPFKHEELIAAAARAWERAKADLARGPLGANWP
jgi:hypothetical protein